MSSGTATGTAPHSPYPTRGAALAGLIDSWGREVSLVPRRVRAASRLRRRAFVAAVHRAASIADPELAALSRDLRRRGYRDGLVARALGAVVATLREDEGDTVADIALWAARGLLQGAVVELMDADTRARAAVLAASVAVLAGRRVHIGVASAERACHWSARFGPALERIGIVAAAIGRGAGAEARREAYGADVIWANHRDLALDALRDAQVLRSASGALDLHVARLTGEGRSSALLLKGLHCLIVDDADRVLVDEARVPVVLTRSVSWTQDVGPMRAALDIAAALEEGRDFSLGDGGEAALSPEGRQRAEARMGGAGSQPLGTRAWEMVRLALYAHHAMERDRDYDVLDGRVVLRNAAEAPPALAAKWDGGLRQLLELKEGCEITPRVETLARSSYLQIFRRYVEIAALCPRARDAQASLGAIYGLWPMGADDPAPVDRALLFARVEDRDDAIVARARDTASASQGLVVRLRTVQAVEALGQRLDQAGIEWQAVRPAASGSGAVDSSRPVRGGVVTLLSAPPGPALESLLASCVTEGVPTHIVLGEADECLRHAASVRSSAWAASPGARIEALYALGDPALARHAGPRSLVWIARRAGRVVPAPLAGWLLGAASRRAERAWFAALAEATRAQDRQRTLLAFSGQDA